MQDQEIRPWLARMIQGDSDAFQYVYEQTKDDVYRLLVFLLNHKEDAGDVMSEVYLNLHRSLPNYNFNQSFQYWLNGLVVRQANNWKRKIWRTIRLFDRAKSYAVEPAGVQADERYLASEQRTEMIALVNRLPYKLREVIVLRHYRDCSLEDIAGILNIPLGTVKSRHHSAIRKLRQLTGQEIVHKEASLHAD
ncbi:sigma-70 family RNA polymerase sigma factor [Cohnella cholangitidis]|uniref:Sigma-70 family RNA polymerase sigma factor n=1 Tax=Cohnella cholangitidis TaxID=2598458 RepID=A0A7G5C0M7_9BACL|nr:sigma-70 family RNA polymerase sigma factor [Cohnella cholangitidis]QMV42761.1 sigma-70 family RNA polymerase sigma factor [Cohnella cholangitidis]